MIGRLSVTTIFSNFSRTCMPGSGTCLCASPTSAIITEYCNDYFSHLSSVRDLTPWRNMMYALRIDSQATKSWMNEQHDIAEIIESILHLPLLNWTLLCGNMLGIPAIARFLIQGSRVTLMGFDKYKITLFDGIKTRI